MKKIAVMTCDKLKNQCSGTSCFEAFHRKKEAFKIYESNEIELGAFFSCNGCNIALAESMAYMFNQLRKKEIATIHIARCIEVECYRYEGIQTMLENEGFQVVHGSH